MQKIIVCLLAAFLTSVVLGQEFEVVSVKPDKSGSYSSHTNSDQGRMTATNVTLRNLVVMAYGMKDYQVEAPDWLSAERYDVAAKFPEALPRNGKLYSEGLQKMMQQMLTQRFKLAVHRDSKSFNVYGLVVEKGGIKFKEVEDTDSHNSNSNNNHFTGKCIPMSRFADFLASRMDVPVLDMTGLKGFYDLTLDWTPEARRQSEGKADVSAASDPGGTLAFALREQLGLKIEPRKAPMEILVVDHAERIPTEN